jgi:hypothetical protein
MGMDKHEFHTKVTSYTKQQYLSAYATTEMVQMPILLNVPFLMGHFCRFSHSLCKNHRTGTIFYLTNITCQFLLLLHQCVDSWVGCNNTIWCGNDSCQVKQWPHIMTSNKSPQSRYQSTFCSYCTMCSLHDCSGCTSNSDCNSANNKHSTVSGFVINWEG